MEVKVVMTLVLTVSCPTSPGPLFKTRTLTNTRVKMTMC